MPKPHISSKFTKKLPRVTYQSELEAGKYGSPHVVRLKESGTSCSFRYMIPYREKTEDGDDWFSWVDEDGTLALVEDPYSPSLEAIDWVKVQDLTKEDMQFLCGGPIPSEKKWAIVRA